MLLPFVFRDALIGLMRSNPARLARDGMPKTSPPQPARVCPGSNPARLASGRNAQNQPAPDSPGVSQIQPCEACVGRFALPVPTEGNCLSPQSGRVCPNGDEKGVRTEQQTQPVDLRHTGLYEGGRKYSGCPRAGVNTWAAQAGGSIRNDLRKIVRIPCTEPAFGVECRSYLEERSDRITKDGRKRGTYEEDISCDRHAE